MTQGYITGSYKSKLGIMMVKEDNIKVYFVVFSGKAKNGGILLGVFRP